MNTFVIGDVHGHYDALMKLVAKLPDNAKLIFVGDLIDRGSQSKEVISFIRENGHLCVLGNHEKIMLDEHHHIFNTYESGTLSFSRRSSIWMQNGGLDTLASYGLFKSPVTDIPELLEDYPINELKQFKEDVEWLRTLPLYIELDIVHPSGKPVVISHAAIADVWNKKEEIDLEEFALWNRDFVFPYTPIFNIFGHTPKTKVDMVENDYVNVDTGYYLDNLRFGKLSAYCIETGEIVSINKREEHE
ncbi:MAG: metallophosphoesterase [Campylobacterota bacterium]